MPRFAIERQYLLPVYQHLEIEAPDFIAACRQALDRDDWESAEEDRDSARETTITAAVEMPDTAPHDPMSATEALYSAGLEPLVIPVEFGGVNTEQQSLLAEL